MSTSGQLVPPKVGEHLILEVLPKEKLLIITLNRPKKLNAVNGPLERDLGRVLDWFEEAPSLWVVILTGAGRAFCAGSDLNAFEDQESQARSNSSASSNNNQKPLRGGAQMLAQPNGFGSLARRRSKKVIIAAMNGLAIGGGAEMVMNSDIVIGLHESLISFPEVRRGVAASVGGIPNLMWRAPSLRPYLLTGQPIPPALVRQFILTESVATPPEVLPAAKKWAGYITECSPDAVQLTKDQINHVVLDGKGVVDTVNTSAKGPFVDRMYDGENIMVGLRAFVEKKQPVWVDPPKLNKAKL